MALSAVDPATYLDLARNLAGSQDPASLRTAGDRAYYAAFLFSRDTLAHKGYITPHYGTDDHQYVAEALKEHLGSFGNEESRLRRARNSMAYDTRGISTAPSVVWMISTAERIVQGVRELPPRRFR